MGSSRFGQSLGILFLFLGLAACGKGSGGSGGGVSPAQDRAEGSKPITLCISDPCKSAFVAAKAGDLKTLKDLLRQGVDPRTTNEQGESLLIIALRFYRDDSAKELCASGAQGPFCRGPYDPSLSKKLADAAGHHDMKLIRDLLEAGADPNEGQSSGWGSVTLPVFQKACYNGDLETVKLLFSYGARINKFGTRRDYLGSTGGATCLGAAFEGSAKSVIKYMIEHGADSRNFGEYDQAAIIAMFRDLHDIYTYVVDSSAASAKNDIYSALLYRFADEPKLLQSRSRYLDYILGKGVSPNSSSYSLLYIAAKSGTSADIEKFLAMGFSVGYADRYGYTPLYELLSRARKELTEDLKKSIQILLTHGATLEEKSFSVLMTPEADQVCQFLVESGVRVPDGTTYEVLKKSVGWELEKYYMPNVRKLMVLGGKLSEVTDNFLDYASDRQVPDAAFCKVGRQLADLGADVNRLTANGKNTFLLAALKLQPECRDLVVYLISKGGTAGLERSLSKFFGYYSSDLKPEQKLLVLDIAEKLIGAGADVNGGLVHIYPPVIGASRFAKSFSGALEFLLKKGADPNVRYSGSSALEYAKQNKYVEAEALLTKYGAK